LLLSYCSALRLLCPVFFPNAPATPELHPLSLHDALPILADPAGAQRHHPRRMRGSRRSAAFSRFDQLAHLQGDARTKLPHSGGIDRKSTRLNSSHVKISYAVFCLKKKNRAGAESATAEHR